MNVIKRPELPETMLGLRRTNESPNHYENSPKLISRLIDRVESGTIFKFLWLCLVLVGQNKL